MRDPALGAPGSAAVVTSFEVPDQLPAGVAKVNVRFQELVGNLADARAELIEAEDAVLVAVQADINSEAVALADGLDAPVDRTEEDAARATAELIRRRVAVCEQAVDGTGDRLLDEIEKAKTTWSASLRREAGDASSRLEAAVREAANALDEISWKVAPLEWLDTFDSEYAKVGATARGLDAIRYRPSLPAPIAQAFSSMSELQRAVIAAGQVSEAQES
jgi:uncharacterized protein YukE